VAALRPDSLATLIYTSGTTGPPKAVMLSQANLEFASHTAQRIGNVTADDILVSYLPLSHVAEQMISIHGPALSGAQVWFCDDLERLGEVLRAARPTIFFAVPRCGRRCKRGSSWRWRARRRCGRSCSAGRG